MDTRQLGDIEINRILELEAPFLKASEMFEAATPEALEPHRSWLEPNALCPKTGRLILPVQSYLVRTTRHTILIDTCIGCRKSYEGIDQDGAGGMNRTLSLPHTRQLNYTGNL